MSPFHHLVSLTSCHIVILFFCHLVSLAACQFVSQLVNLLQSLSASQLASLHILVLVQVETIQLVASCAPNLVFNFGSMMTARVMGHFDSAFDILKLL